jgi:hypothetical protein
MTVGWIFEGDRDRFLAWRDSVPDLKPALPSFQCPFCKTSFDERNKLNAHIQSAHKIRRPFLLIGGVEPGGDETVRVRLGSQSIELFDCTELSAAFDGELLRPITPTSFLQTLRKAKRSTVQIQLVNAGDGSTEPVIYRYRLRIFAPDAAALAEMDELFLAKLGVKEVNLEKVGAFYEATRDGPAAEYAEALADYVRAVLIKDGDTHTGVSTKLNHYRDVQNRSLYTLQVFANPLAKLLCGLIRFGLNDFTRWQDPVGFPRLDRAYSILGPLAHQDQMQYANKKIRAATGKDNQVFICPVDVGTDTVVLLAKQADELSRWGSAAEKQFGALADQASMDPLDRAKIRALWAATALRLEAYKSAQVALRTLDGDPTFGGWAAEHLARAET